MTLPEETSKPANDRAPRWLLWVGLAAIVAAANIGYGFVCDSRCGDLCKEQGLAGATWISSSGFWLRLLSASGGNHGTCLCSSGGPVSALRPAQFKEIKLTFGK